MKGKHSVLRSAVFHLTLEHVTWKSIGIIYSLRSTPAPSLVLINWRCQKILSGQHLVYRPTDRHTNRPTYSCKTICPLFQGWHQNWGQWCKFRDICQSIQISDKNQGWFHSEFYNLRQVSSKKYNNCFKIIFEPCFKYPQCIRKVTPLEIKIYWIQFQLTELTKIEDFEYFCSKSYLQKEVSCKSCFYFNINAGCIRPVDRRNICEVNGFMINVNPFFYLDTQHC